MKPIKIIEIIKNEAEKKGYKCQILPSGILVILDRTNNNIIAQIGVAREYYYVNYATTGQFYVLRRIDEEIVSKILFNKLDDLVDNESIIRLDQQE